MTTLRRVEERPKNNTPDSKASGDQAEVEEPVQDMEEHPVSWRKGRRMRCCRSQKKKEKVLQEEFGFLFCFYFSEVAMCVDYLERSNKIKIEK